MRFIHAADVHLDSPLIGLQQYPGAPVDEIRGATRRALENLVDLALEQQVDFLLIAGDLYDGDWKDHNTGLFFVSQMVRLREADIPVIMIRGNHDAQSKMTKSLKLPENVETLSHRKPQTATSSRLREMGVAIHGRSFAKPAEFDNMVADYPDRQSGMFNVGLLHTSLNGAEGHEPYAPCTVGDLKAKGYDYWALGHIHARATVSTDPLIVFSGNVQGRHIRETGEKGCMLVTVDDQAKVDIQFEPLDVFRWQQCVVDASGANEGDMVLDRFCSQLTELVNAAGGKSLALRVILVGACHAHQKLLADPVEWTNQIRSTAIDLTGGMVWIEKVKYQTQPIRELNERHTFDGPVGDLIEFLRASQNDEEQLRRLAGEFSGLRKKLPDELNRGAEALNWENAAWLSDILTEVEPLLIGRLASTEGER